MAGNKTLLYDRFYNRIADTMKQPQKVNELNKILSDIISRNSEALSSTVPDKPIFIDKRVEDKYYNIVGITPQDILKAIKESEGIDSNWQTIKTHQYSMLALYIIYFHHVKNKKMMELTAFIYSLYMYRNVRHKHFPKGVSESTSRVMQYTLSRLSRKNDLVVEGSIMNLITKKTKTIIELWETKPELQGVVTDHDICKMTNDNHRRYDTVIINFHRELDIDLKSGNYLNVDKDIDDGDQFIQSDNVSYMVEGNTQRIMNHFNLTMSPNEKLMDIVAKNITCCSKNKLRNMVAYLINNNKVMERIVRVTLQIYLFDKKKNVDDIKSFDFITEMLRYYKGQTKTDKNLSELKRNIDLVYDNTLAITSPTKREPTINDLKRGLYQYILYYIMSRVLN